MTTNFVPTAISRQPSNKNTLLDNKFRFSLFKIPHVEYFLQSVTLPGFSIPVLNEPNPFMNFPLAATQVSFDQNFTITFELDENMNNYKEIYNWMIGITAPDDKIQYANFIKSNTTLGSTVNLNNIYSDGRLIIYTAQFNRKLEIIFENMFPTSLSRNRL